MREDYAQHRKACQAHHPAFNSRRWDFGFWYRPFSLFIAFSTFRAMTRGIIALDNSSELTGVGDARN